MTHRWEAPRPTLAEMRQAAPWLWLWCRKGHCRHKSPIVLAPLSIRWSGDASSDRLRRSARCGCCGGKGADLQHLALDRATSRWQFTHERKIGARTRAFMVKLFTWGRAPPRVWVTEAPALFGS